MKMKNWITFIAVLALLIPLLVACGGDEAYQDELLDDPTIDETYQDEPAVDETYQDAPAAQDSADMVPAENEFYLDRPEDCLDGEEYDAVEQLCYDPYDDGSDDLLSQFFDLVDGAMADGNTTGDDYVEANEQRIMVYSLQGNQLTNPQEEAIPPDLQAYQDARDTHAQIWAYFAGLIPQDQRGDLVSFVIFTDGPDETLAAVEQIPDDPHKWLLAVDIADAGNMTELTYTLVHEFGHLLTLNQQQVPPDESLFSNPDDQALYEQAAQSCPNYFPGEGCALPQSYINTFYDRFWTDIEPDWSEVNALEDQDAFDQALADFYQQYQDQFVTEYAATNPGEDIAESFAYFVLKPKPSGDTIADQKVLFFYDFPELLKLRNQMIERTYSRLRRAP